MRFIVFFCCFMLIYTISAEFEDEREKEKNDKIRSVLSQASLMTKRNHNHTGFLFNLVELLLDVVNDMRADFKRFKTQNDSTGIGFTATTVGIKTKIKAEEPINFSRMINDYGKGFKIENGRFVCQKSGLYQFSASVCTITANVWVRFYKNNKAIGYLYKDFDSNWGSGSGSTVVRMAKGDKLHLAPHKDSFIHEGVTIISGFRISK